MFAENEKISVHQLRGLLFLDWVGKLLLLMPVLCGGLQGWNYLAALFLGLFWMALYSALTARISGSMEGTYTSYIRRRAGAHIAWINGGAAALYLFFNQAFLIRLITRICGIYLLPDAPELLVGGAALLAAFATAAGSGEQRGRTAQFLALPVGIALAVMLIACVGSAKPGNYRITEAAAPLEILYGSGRVFAGCIGVSLVLYETPYISWKKKNRSRELLGCVQIPAFFLAAAFVTALGVFGASGLSRLDWPVLVLMGSAHLPGGFLQRWDTVFLAFLLFSLLLAAGTCSHYQERILGELFPGKDRRKILRWAFAANLFLFFATRSYEGSLRLYTRWAVRCLIPVMAAVPVIFWTMERAGKKWDRKR